MLRLDLCKYGDAYIVVKGQISVTGTNDDSKRNKKLIFKNNAPFGSYKSKLINTIIDNAKDLDIVLPIYNLLKHSNKYFLISGGFWNYYRDKTNDDEN